MNLKNPLITFSAILLLSLSGCSSQKTPEEVAQSFWNAVIANDVEGINQHVASNTLQDPGLLSNSDKTLDKVELGAVTTHEQKAEIVTTLIGNKEDQEIRLPVTTYLVLEEEAWKVHGQESVNALVAASMNLMMNDMTGSLSALGNELNNSITSGLQEFISAFSKEAPAIKEELSRLTDEEKTRDIGEQLGKLFSEGLRNAMKELNTGLEELNRELETANQGAEQPANGGQ